MRLKSLLIAAAVAATTASFAFPSERASAAVGLCHNDQGKTIPSESVPGDKEVVIVACRKRAPGNRAWLEYGQLYIGERATVADRCLIKIRTVYHTGAGQVRATALRQLRARDPAQQLLRVRRPHGSERGPAGHGVLLRAP
jgi:hypothetical protein